MSDKRITVRFNGKEEAELQLLRKTYGLENDSETIKLAINWVLTYIRSVTDSYFPSTHEVVLIRKKKTEKLSRRIY